MMNLGITIKNLKIFLAIFSCFVSLLIGVEWASGQSQDTAKLIAEAKKEGELVLYGTKNIDDQTAVTNKFQEKYPFLKVEVSKIGSEKILAKVLTEVRAGKLLADVLQGNGFVMYTLKKEGVLGYYLSPEDRFYAKEFKDEGYWTTADTNIHVIAYNTKKVARENLPKSYDDLLKPFWKGKIMMDLAEQWFANMLQIMGREKGLNYMRELAKQNLSIRTGLSNNMRAQLLAAGEADLDITQVLGAVDVLKKKGASIDWTTLGPTPAPLGGFGISARPNHPNAAKLFVDFILSKEGQKIFLNLGRQVVRSDLLEEQEVFKNIKLVPLDPSLGEHIADYTKLMNETLKQK